MDGWRSNPASVHEPARRDAIHLPRATCRSSISLPCDVVTISPKRFRIFGGTLRSDLDFPILPPAPTDDATTWTLHVKAAPAPDCAAAPLHVEQLDASLSRLGLPHTRRLAHRVHRYRRLRRRRRRALDHLVSSSRRRRGERSARRRRDAAPLRAAPHRPARVARKRRRVRGGRRRLPRPVGGRQVDAGDESHHRGSALPLGRRAAGAHRRIGGIRGAGCTQSALSRGFVRALQ